jgi:hypothetical protein
MVRINGFAYRLAIAGIAILTACGDSANLTSPSDPLSRPLTESLAFNPSGESFLEDFDCTAIGEVRVRFSSPGYVEDDRVGLYVYFAGLPEGPKRLRIWWDHENDPVHFRDFRFPEDAAEIEEIYEHSYSDLREPTEKVVRVEFIRDGLTGNCPRNRRVLVQPPQRASGPSGPATQTAAVGPGIGSVDSYDFLSYSDGVFFSVLTPLTIDSVWVDPGAAGTLGITLWDSSGTVALNSTTLAVAAGPQQVAVGFAVPPGDYYLTLDGTTIGPPGVGATMSGSASYPYEIPGVISLTNSAWGFGSLFGWYFFLYDWQVTW